MPVLLRLLACLLLLGAAGCNRLAKHPLAIEATEEVQANARCAEWILTSEEVEDVRALVA